MNSSLCSRLQVIQPILLRLLKEKKEIEDSAKRDGKIPQELCKLCSASSRLVRTKILPLRDKEGSSLSAFLKWIEESKIISVKGQFYSGIASIDVEAKEPIGRRKPKSLEKGAYHYSYPLSELKKRPFYSSLIAKFDGLQTCPHFDPSTPRVVRLFQQETDMLGETRVSKLLFFCCVNVFRKRRRLLVIVESLGKVSSTQFIVTLMDLSLRRYSERNRWNMRKERKRKVCFFRMRVQCFS